MRRYKLEITDMNGNIPVDENGNKIGPFDTADTPGRGLQIVFDALIAGYDTVTSGSMIAIHGLPVSMLKQSVQLAGCQLIFSAGFSQGLPLANKHQFGEIVNGIIYNPYANWLGTHQSMNLIVNPSPLVNGNGDNFSITIGGKKGEKIRDILQRAFIASFPKDKGFTFDINISDALVLSEDSPGIYAKVSALALALRSLSKDIIKADDYSGVQVSIHGKNIRVFDNLGTGFNGVKTILPQELIGQPTWIAYNAVSFKCPLRHDIHNGDVVKLPANVISGPASILSVNSASSNAWMRENQVSFSGEFQVVSVRHVGEYLSPDASNSWVTIYEAVAWSRNE